LIVFGLGAAACSSDINRFDGALSNPYASRGPSPEVTGSVHAQSAPAGRVESQPLPQPYAAQPLPPPPASRPVSYAASTPTPNAPTYAGAMRAPAYTGATPAYTGATAAPAYGRGSPDWNREGGTLITVGPGDTLYSLSQRYGVPTTAIIQANGLSGSVLRTGQQIVIPRYQAAVAAQAAAPRARAFRPAARAPALGSQVHVVAPGETLYAIARRYGRSVTEIAAANRIPAHTHLKLGDRIVIPRTTAAAAPEPQPASEPVQARSSGPTKVASIEPAATARAVTPAKEAQADDPDPPRESGGNLAFRWPVRGRVITGFGAKNSGQQNDGINLAVPEGTAIRAAEDGVVAYAGNELKGYGNLILVRHANGYVTAYAHASEIAVKRNDPVRRGQVIGRSGQTGSVNSPQLHFEIRKGSSPVDPMQFLPAGA
jgi:murein DD-endopeptidase MepM/ murein hydrolase activator NlpD